ncbi:MAG: 6-bladed beta-propeller [Lentimicrobium sp.]|jgi:hypothetical protein|nr:6-bladed beta-propeller [Lentimicrobium sp.]
MKKFNKFNFALLFLITLAFFETSGCTAKEKNSGTDSLNVVSPDIENVNSPEYWGEFVSDINFVVLETTENSILSRIQKIVADENYYYIMDKKRVCIFDKNGKFVETIPKIGKGPGETIKIHDFSLDNSIIYLLTTQGRVMRYKNLKFLDEYNIQRKELPISPRGIHIQNGISYYWMDRYGVSLKKNDQKYLLLYSNEAGELRPHVGLKYFTTGTSRFNQSNDYTMLTPPIGNDTLFSLTEKGLRPEFLINFGKYSSSREDINISKELEDPYAMLSDLTKMKLVGEIFYVVKNQQYTNLLFPNPLTEGRYCNLIINNKNFKPTVISLSPSTNIFYPGVIFCSYNDQFISEKEAYIAVNCIENNLTECSFLPEHRRLELLEKLKGVKATDNPLLMLTSFKK